MKHKILFIILLLVGSLLVPVSVVLAHDPGLSRAKVTLNETGLVIQMVFARQDVEVLVPMDTDYDGSVSVEEFSIAKSRLIPAFTTGVEVQGSGKLRQPDSVSVEQAANDAVGVELNYIYEDVSALQVHIPLLTQLARGHRQYLTLEDANGNLLAQSIVNAASKAVVLDGAGPDRPGVFREYLREGVWHIWKGFDHILFLLTLLLPAVLVYQKTRWLSRDTLRPAIMDILKVVTAFTVAHSITLALAVLDIVSLPPRLVESVIAFSVLVTAVNNLWPVFPASRWLLAFVFGLVHGFGFASVLMDLGLPGNALVISLLGFNLGVEAGQLAIVALVFPVAAFLRHTSFYRNWMFSGGSAMAAIIAIVWMYERAFEYEALIF